MFDMISISWNLQKFPLWFSMWPILENVPCALGKNLFSVAFWWLLLLLSRFSCVRLCATPWTAAHQAFLSLGFSRKEHWNGLAFPSPMDESEKWKWSCSLTPDSYGLQPTRLLRPWDFPGKSTWVGCHCLPHRWCEVNYILFISLNVNVYAFTREILFDFRVEVGI